MEVTKKQQYNYGYGYCRLLKRNECYQWQLNLTFSLYVWCDKEDIISCLWVEFCNVKLADYYNSH